MVVVDASAAIAVLINMPPSAERLRARLAREDDTLHVPHLFDVEVLAGLRRHVQRGWLSAADGDWAVADLEEMRLIRYPHLPLIDRVWGLRSNLTPYDAAYVALAKALDAPLVTLDARIERAPGHGARVEVYS